MIAACSTKSGLLRYPAKIVAWQNCWDTSTVIQLKCWRYAMLNFSGRRVRANYSAGGTRLIPNHPLKRVRANLYSGERFFCYRVCPRFRPNGRFFRCADNENNNEITLRSITRRYPRRLPIRVCIGFFSRSISNISEFVYANSYQMRTRTKSHATKIYLRCGCVACPQTKICIIRNTAVIVLSFAIFALSLCSL